MNACQDGGVEPFKAYSGKFVLRIPPEDHAAVSRAAIASGKSLNQWAVEVLKQAASSDVQKAGRGMVAPSLGFFA